MEGNLQIGFNEFNLSASKVFGIETSFPTIVLALCAESAFLKQKQSVRQF